MSFSRAFRKSNFPLGDGTPAIKKSQILKKLHQNTEKIEHSKT
jgi:hypothetical protein